METQSRVRALLERYYDIWSTTGALPLHWGEHLTQWARAALASGLYERAGNSSYAHRIHLAFKEGPAGKVRGFRGPRHRRLRDFTRLHFEGCPFCAYASWPA